MSFIRLSISDYENSLCWITAEPLRALLEAAWQLEPSRRPRAPELVARLTDFLASCHDVPLAAQEPGPASTDHHQPGTDADSSVERRLSELAAEASGTDGELTRQGSLGLHPWLPASSCAYTPQVLLISLECVFCMFHWYIRCGLRSPLSGSMSSCRSCTNLLSIQTSQPCTSKCMWSLGLLSRLDQPTTAFYW